jgi:hypothetical protein
MNLTIPLLGGMPFFGGEGATFKIWLSQGIIFKIQVNFLIKKYRFIRLHLKLKSQIVNYHKIYTKIKKRKIKDDFNSINLL